MVKCCTMNILFFWILLIVAAVALALIIFWPIFSIPNRVLVVGEGLAPGRQRAFPRRAPTKNQKSMSVEYRKRFLLFIFCVFIFTALAVSLYYYWGSSKALTAYYQEQEKSQQVKTLLQRFKNTQQIIAAMKKAIAKNPNKAKGWYLLGQLYRSENTEQALPESILAFQHAYQLNPHQFNYTFAYLQSLYRQSNQQYTPEIQMLIRQLKKQWQKKPELLDFLGYDAYMHQDYTSAIDYWEKLLPYLVDNPKAHKAVLLAIGKAEKKLLK